MMCGSWKYPNLAAEHLLSAASSAVACDPFKADIVVVVPHCSVAQPITGRGLRTTPPSGEGRNSTSCERGVRTGVDLGLQNMTLEVVVVGGANHDVTAYAPRLPRPGETVNGKECHYDFGGKGANQAVQAAYTLDKGGAVGLLCKVGADDVGINMAYYLKKCNVSNSMICTTAAHPTGMALIQVGSDSGENSIICITGANDHLVPSDIDEEKIQILQKAKVVVAVNEIPLDTIARAIEVAKSGGAMTIFSPAPMSNDFPPSLLSSIDILVANRGEAAQMAIVYAGLKEREVSPMEAAEALNLKFPFKAIVVTLGADGCLVARRDQKIVKIPAPGFKFLGPAIDSTGAGDSMVGAFAASLATGASVEEAARLGCSVASLSVRKKGASGSFPNRAEAEEAFSHPDYQSWLRSLGAA